MTQQPDDASMTGPPPDSRVTEKPADEPVTEQPADEPVTEQPTVAASPASPSPAPQTSSTPPISPAPAVPSTPTVPATDYTDAGVPTLDYLQDKVEKRYATSLGSTELAQGTAAGKSLAEQRAERERLAAEKLEQLRKSLHPDG